MRKGSIASRGTTIITQKENKGEYRGIHCWGNTASECAGPLYDTSDKWKWNTSPDDWDIYAHVFDQNGKRNGNMSNIPIRYANNATDYYNTDDIPQCSDYDGPTALLEKAKGLYGNNYEKIIKDQYSCNPYPISPGLNAGNYYNFAAATAGSKTDSGVNYPYDAKNSICPKGWQLPSNSGTKSYQRLIRDVYQIADGPSGSIDSNLLANSAMSFVRLGDYYYDYGSLFNRGLDGSYWSSTAFSSVDSHNLLFNSGYLSPQDGSNRARGFSIRCVSR